MYIQESEVIGYKYEVSYDGCVIHSDDEIFDTEKEAYEEAGIYIEQQINDWKIEDAWHEETGEDNESLFSVEVNEVVA